MNARRGLRTLPAALALALALAGCDGAARQPASEAEPERSAGGDAPAMVHDAASETAVPAAPAVVQPAAATEPALPSDPVYLNGQQLSAPDLRELQAVFGQAPAPGRYWYDPHSGLWGLEQHGAGGVTRTGLRVPAAVPPDASAGTSGVFVNDRQLTARELAVLAQLIGWTSARELTGRYTVDEQGGLYSIQGRYLGSLVNAAQRALKQSTSPAPCAWLSLGAPPDVLGQAVTINCD